MLFHSLSLSSLCAGALKYENGYVPTEYSYVNAYTFDPPRLKLHSEFVSSRKKRFKDE
jgi:hypothetical protein